MGFESWGSVLAISIVRGAAERLAGLRVWEAFVFVFIEGKLTGVCSAHVTSCKISMLHAPWLPCWCFNSCKGWCANKMALLPFFFTAEPGSAAPLGLPQHSRAFSDGCCRPGGLVGLVSFLLRVLFCSGLSLSFTCRVPVAIAVVPTPCCNECSLAPWRSVYIGSYSPGCSEDL